MHINFDRYDTTGCGYFYIEGILVSVAAVLWGHLAGIISTVALMVRNRGGYRRIANDRVGGHIGSLYGVFAEFSIGPAVSTVLRRRACESSLTS